jgi:O-antigen chain-terminating methyltransferase
MAERDGEPEQLAALRQRLDREVSSYAAVLAAIDRLASLPLPAEALPELPEQLRRLNALWEPPPPPPDGGPLALRRRVWSAVTPALARQQEFNAVLVQLLNGYLDRTSRLHDQLRELVSALVGYLQRVLPVMDARDRLASALATTRSELILEAFDRRLESLARRLEGLLALRDRLESVSEEVRALRAGLADGRPAPAAAAAAERAAADSAYVAFENRFRGEREEVRERLGCYLPLLAEAAPVVDLGCGRGEMLELLREAGIAARGVEANAQAAAECRRRGLDVVEDDLVAFLGAQADGALGAVFAAQVAEHLPPAVLQALLRESHRALRSGGLLVLETVNPRSVIGFLEVYNRDLTHERPLHPDTLRFLAAAQGFSDVRVELRSPVDAASRLQPIPTDGLPERAARALNENVERLNAFLYGPQEYALIARR